jgi:hypothetical protein
VVKQSTIQLLLNLIQIGSNPARDGQIDRSGRVGLNQIDTNKGVTTTQSSNSIPLRPIGGDGVASDCSIEGSSDCTCDRACASALPIALLLQSDIGLTSEHHHSHWLCKWELDWLGVSSSYVFRQSVIFLVITSVQTRLIWSAISRLDRHLLTVLMKAQLYNYAMRIKLWTRITLLQLLRHNHANTSDGEDVV